MYLHIKFYVNLTYDAKVMSQKTPIQGQGDKKRTRGQKIDKCFLQLPIIKVKYPIYATLCFESSPTNIDLSITSLPKQMKLTTILIHLHDSCNCLKSLAKSKCDLLRWFPVSNAKTMHSKTKFCILFRCYI